MITCKKTWFAVFLSTAFAFAAFAQKPQDYASSGFLTEPDLAFYGKTYAPYKIKAQFVGGWIYPHDKNTITPLVNGPALGAEIAFEWGMDGSKRWHRDYNLPDVGVMMQILDLGNPAITGQMISLGTYINLPMVKTDIVSFNIKIGGGAGFSTKPCDVQAAIADPRSINDKAGDYNFAIGSVFSFNPTAGANLEIKVHPNISLAFDVAYNHFSNASLAQPNSGLNLFDGHVGLKYMPVRKQLPPRTAMKDSISTKLKRWSGEVILSGGAKKLYYQDSRYFGCASLNVGGYYRTCRQHRVGLGLDLFYDGAYVPTANPDGSRNTEFTKFARTYTTENLFANKLRFGINIANDLIIGRLMIGFQFGIYLYDPVKNMEPYDKAKAGETDKGIFYAYDIQDEDGWNYFRILCKYYITDHFLANLSFKTHLQKVEFVEFGLGYAF